MIDLQDLEKMVDDAFAKETDESLTEWLLLKRTRSLVGEGMFHSLKTDITEFDHEPGSITCSQPIEVIPEDNYVLAA